MPRRSQRPVPGGRKPLGSSVLTAIRRAVEADARRYNVSKSFVISVALAETYGIDEQEQFIVAGARWRSTPRHLRRRAS